MLPVRLQKSERFRCSSDPQGQSRVRQPPDWPQMVSSMTFVTSVLVVTVVVDKDDEDEDKDLKKSTGQYFRTFLKYKT